MTDAPPAYPLQWPEGRPRARQRVLGKFSTTKRSPLDNPSSKPLTLAEARIRLANELNRLGARYPVLSSNVELKLNGEPRSGLPEPRDPGVAVYFQLAGKAIVMACDHYDRVAQNIAAIAGHIEATRRIERYGVATAAEMFKGFEALPPPSDWRSALGNPRNRTEAENAYRVRAMSAHPDRGGSHDQMARLNVAINAARREYGA